MFVDFWKQLEEYYKSLQLNGNDTVDLAQFTRLFLYSSIKVDQLNTSNLLSYNVEDLIQVILKFVDEIQPRHYPSPSPYTYDMPPFHGADENHSEDDSGKNEAININEPATSEEIRDVDLRQEAIVNNGILYRLNEFVCDYNKARPMDRQINGNAISRCFRDNIMDYTDFSDLYRNLKPYGVRAGAVRKLWRFLNPVDENENEQDDEGVIVISPGSYIYIPSEYEYEGILPEDNNDEFIPFEYQYEGIEFDDNEDENNKDNNEEYIDFESGDNLSVPSDWSDDDE